MYKKNNSRYSGEYRNYEPTGELEFILGRWDSNQWRDGKDKLETKLAKIVATILLKVEEEAKWLEECRIHRELEEKQIEYNRIRNLAIEKDTQNFEKFVKDYNVWQKMTKLNEFIALIKNTTVNPAIEAHKQEWLKWAKEKANQMAPLKLGVENYLTKFEIVTIPEEFDPDN